MSLMTDPTIATPRQMNNSFSVEGCVTSRLAAVPIATCVFPVMLNPFKNKNKRERLFLPLLSYLILGQKETKNLRNQMIHNPTACVLF